MLVIIFENVIVYNFDTIIAKNNEFVTVGPTHENKFQVMHWLTDSTFECEIV